jgi:hypothetical protein
MSNIIAIATDKHTYMARLRGTGRTSKIWSHCGILIGANCNTRNQLHRIKSFVPDAWTRGELAETYIARTWRTALAEHLHAQIDPDQGNVRFELLLAYGPMLFSIQHLPEKRGFASLKVCLTAATQYWADSDLCDASLELTQGEDVTVRLVAAMAAGVGNALAAKIEAGTRRVTVYIT